MVKEGKFVKPTLPEKKPNEKPRESHTAEPSKLVQFLKRALNSTCKTPRKSDFTFENTTEAAAENSRLLLSFGGNVKRAIENEKGSMLTPSTEFRDEQFIKPLFDLHEDGDKLSSMVMEGAKYPFKEDIIYSKEQRLQDNEAAVTRGNNGSAKGKEKVLMSRYSKEVEKGWMLPFNLGDIPDIDDIGLIPIGIATQTTIDETGKSIPKDRLTHDCSRAQEISGLSVNIMTDDDLLEVCRFGMALMRLIYQIHQLRLEFPNTPIVISKLDFDSAYRRIHVFLQHALLCCSIIGPICYILFRLPFGSSAAPGLFSMLSEFTADLAQSLIEDSTWNPLELFSNLSNEITLAELTVGPFAIAKTLAVNIMAKQISIEVYIDDLITVCLLLPGNFERAKQALPLILDCLFRPTSLTETVQRNPILQQAKLMAEGMFEEIKIVLGWLIDTRRLRIFYPKMKARLLVLELEDLLSTYTKKEDVNAKKLERIIGKLTNISFLIPEGRFFLNRLRFRHSRCNFANCKKFDDMEGRDIAFWIEATKTLSEGHVGRSFNSILNTLPSILAFSDACEIGLGGFFLIGDNAFAWRFELPDDLQGVFTLNLLEFIAAIWTFRMAARAVPGSRIRSFADSTNALSWMKKNNHRPDLQPAHDIIARFFGKILLDYDCSADNAFLAGVRNKIADAISRDTHVPHLALIQALREHELTKDMMVESFHIYSQNEEELYEFLRKIKQQLTNVEPSPKRRIPSGLVIGADGSNTYPLSTKRMTPFSNELQMMKDIREATISNPSLSAIDITILEQKLMVKSEPRDSDHASALLHRGSKMKVSQDQ